VYLFSFYELCWLVVFFRYDWVAKKSLFNGYFLWASAGYGLGKPSYILGIGFFVAFCREHRFICLIFYEQCVTPTTVFSGRVSWLSPWDVMNRIQMQKGNISTCQVFFQFVITEGFQNER